MNVIKYLFVLVLVIGCKNDYKSEVDNVGAIEPTQITMDNDVSKNLQLLQGSWQNTVDTLSIIKIEGSIITNLYSGKAAGPGVKISMGANCQNNPDPNRKSEKDRYISIAGKFTDCYYITKLDQENLSLNFLNGGFDLTFKRIK